ncbi:hypothetical protein M9H77_34529 [Catharanthus roseus]|uniref:Uncharacterized protein n=1 Tax=Catharanthus roseus TaxID=4058 RepID=A0ACB9ZN53_CATRO|nr:hypothetical protein M9H77_34529 [Catharanthus roseus]
MSADLEFRPELLEIRLPPITVKVSSHSNLNTATHEEPDDCQTPKITAQNHFTTDEEQDHELICKTPKSPKHMIPKILSCPPAPRKPPRKVASCKRKLSELQFFDVVSRDEIDSFFRQFDVNSKRRSCTFV